MDLWGAWEASGSWVGSKDLNKWAPKMFFKSLWAPLCRFWVRFGVSSGIGNPCKSWFGGNLDFSISPTNIFQMFVFLVFSKEIQHFRCVETPSQTTIKCFYFLKRLIFLCINSFFCSKLWPQSWLARLKDFVFFLNILFLWTFHAWANNEVRNCCFEGE